MRRLRCLLGLHDWDEGSRGSGLVLSDRYTFRLCRRPGCHGVAYRRLY